MKLGTIKGDNLELKPRPYTEEILQVSLNQGNSGPTPGMEAWETMCDYGNRRPDWIPKPLPCVEKYFETKKVLSVGRLLLVII